MFDANMDSLFNDSSIDLLVNTDTNGALGHVEDDTSASVVALVWHTLVDGGIREDVDIISHLDVDQILRQVDGTMLTKLLRKHVARTRTGTKGVRHLGGSVAVESKIS